MVALVCRNNKSTRYAAPLQSLKHQFQLYPRFNGQEIPTLTDQQRNEFDRNGFLIIEQALTNDEISRYRHVIDRFDHTIAENYGGVINSTARKAGEHLELRNAVAQADELLDLMVQPTTFPLLTQLMNGHITLTTSHAFIRPTSPKGTKKDSKQIGWHRDGPAYGASEQNGVLPWLITKIGYFLTDTTIPDCAALRIIPQIFRSSSNCRRRIRTLRGY